MEHAIKKILNLVSFLRQEKAIHDKRCGRLIPLPPHPLPANPSYTNPSAIFRYASLTLSLSSGTLPFHLLIHILISVPSNIFFVLFLCRSSPHVSRSFFLYNIPQLFFCRSCHNIVSMCRADPSSAVKSSTTVPLYPGSSFVYGGNMLSYFLKI